MDGTQFKRSTKLNLEHSLSPMWKLTYYLRLTFDWCHRIPNQRTAIKILHGLIIFFSLIYQLYLTCFYFLLLCQSMNAKPENQFLDIVRGMLLLSDQPLILFVWLYFLLRRTQIQAFFYDWENMEEHHHAKGIDPRKIKRTCILVYTLFSAYCLFALSHCFLNILTRDDSTAPITEDEDLIAGIYPNLISNTPYITWVKIQPIFSQLLYNIFSALIDIVPSLVYYHAAKMVESIRWEILELTNSSPLSKCELLRSLWCRFETLIEMVERADALFGVMIIGCHAVLFFNICGIVYFLLKLTTNSSIDVPETLTIFLLDSFLYHPLRLFFTIFFNEPTSYLIW